MGYLKTRILRKTDLFVKIQKQKDGRKSFWQEAVGKQLIKVNI
jgi:hypothetical protein